jgi:hypothetical protein
MRHTFQVLGLCSMLVTISSCKHSGADSSALGTDSGKPGSGFLGTATYFDGVSDAGGGCGTPPYLMLEESGGRFVALNVHDTPSDYSDGKPRPNLSGNGLGMYANGRNCGRWIKVTLDDVCSGLSNGLPGQALCQGGSYKPDANNGATQYFLVSDSCGDGNAWCRDDRFHVDLSTSGIQTFMKNGQQLKMNGWSNRRVRWEFVKAPQYQGDLKFGFVKDNFMRGNQGAWVSLIITNLPNGISRVEAKAVGSKDFVTLKMVGDNGQKFEGLPTSSNEWLVRVYDYDGALVTIGGKSTYQLKWPCGSERCPKLFNEPLGGYTKQP